MSTTTLGDGIINTNHIDEMESHDAFINGSDDED